MLYDTTPNAAATTTITGITNATDITALKAKSYINTFVASGVTQINGTAAAVSQAISDLGVGKPTNFSSTLTGSATAADIATINTNNGSGTITATAVSSLSGTPSALVTSIGHLAAEPISVTTTTVSGTGNATDISTLQAKGYINTLVGSGLTAINGTTTQITAALSDLTTDPSGFTSTITGTIVATELQAINNATSGALSLSGNTTQALSGTAEVLKEGLTGISGYAGAVTFSNVATAAADITSVNALTSSTLNGAALRSISGTASDIVTALSHLDSDPSSGMSSVVVSGVATASHISSIIGETFITAIAGSGITSIDGTVSAINSAVTSLGAGKPTNFNSTLTGTSTAAAISTLAGNNGSGTITGTSLTGISGTPDAIITALGLISAPTSITTTTISGSVLASNINTLKARSYINTFDATAITAISGTATDVKNAIDNLAGNDPTNFNVTITGIATAAEITSIHAAIGTGTITATNINSISGITSDVKAQIANLDVKPSASTAALSGTTVASDVSTILGYSYITSVSGLGLTSLSGTTTEVETAIGDLNGNDPANYAATITGSATASQISTIHTALGTGNLTATGVTGLSGTASALKTAVLLFNTDPDAVTTTTVTGAASAADISTLKAKSYINTLVGTDLTAINGTTTEITAALTALTSDPGAFTSTITGTIVATELQTINNATSGGLTLSGNTTQALSGSAAVLKEALTGISGYAGAVTFTNVATAAADITSVNSLTSSTLNGAALRSISGTSSDIATALTHLDTPPSGAMSSVALSGSAAASDVASLIAKSYITAINGSSITAITGSASDVATAITTITSEPDNYAVTLTGEVTASQVDSIHTSMGSGTLTGTAITKITGSAADVITAIGNINNRPTNVNVTLTGTGTAAQFKTIDGLIGTGTITGSVSDSAANIATFLGNENASDTNSILGQATNVAITGYSGQDLSELSDVTTSTTFELIAAGTLSITHAQAAHLNVLDKITVTGNSGTLTLSGESFTPGTSATHFGSLANISTSGSSNTVAIADYGTGSDGSTIDLKQLTTVSGFDSVTVAGDTGANVIQLSVALSTSGKTQVDLKNDAAVDRLIFNTDPDSDPNSYLSSGTNLGYTTVSYFDAGNEKDKLGIFYGSTSAIGSFEPTSATGDGVLAISTDLALIEKDKRSTMTNGTSKFDSVDEIKSIIAGSITSVGSDADRLVYVNYGYDLDESQMDTYVFASELSGARGASNLAGSDSFTVVPVARLVNVGGDDADAFSFSNTTIKPSGLNLD